MKRILANDGMDAAGKSILEKAGFEVVTQKVAQAELAKAINANNYVAITVRSATEVRKDLIDACPSLKLIGRAGVGMDNIDVEHAKSKGISVINTPASSSNSVAELVIGQLFSMARYTYDSNRNMPSIGNTQFDVLKKKYASGTELSGKTIGIIGIGRIGQAVAKIALGCGMKVIAYDPFLKDVKIAISIFGAETIHVEIQTIELKDLLSQSDFITMHVPGGKLISAKDFELMKNNVCIVNAARGGVIDENDLINALNNGKVAHAALDVFENEPQPSAEILHHPKISLTPHIGAATIEAQERIGIELAEKIYEILGK